MDSYHGVQALDLNFQRLLLFEQLLHLHLPREHGLVVLGFRHFDVFKLEKEEDECEINKRNPEESSLSG